MKYNIGDKVEMLEDYGNWKKGNRHVILDITYYSGGSGNVYWFDRKNHNGVYAKYIKSVNSIVEIW